MALAARLAICISATLTVLMQQPVTPNETDTLVNNFVGETIVARGRLASVPTPSLVTESTTVYDTTSKEWKRYFTEISASGIESAIRVAISKDQKSWTTREQICFAPALDADEWDHSSVTAPVVVFNPEAPSDRRFSMWYVGKNDRMKHADQFNESHLGLAISSDGLEFKRLPACESPYSTDGLVLIGNDAFPENRQVSEGSLANPHVGKNSNCYELTFSKVGRTSGGALISAGVSQAVSKDGIHWEVAQNPTLSLECVGHAADAPKLQSRLKQLASAYAEAL